MFARKNKNVGIFSGPIFWWCVSPLLLSLPLRSPPCFFVAFVLFCFVLSGCFPLLFELGVEYFRIPASSHRASAYPDVCIMTRAKPSTGDHRSSGEHGVQGIANSSPSPLYGRLALTYIEYAPKIFAGITLLWRCAKL